MPPTALAPGVPTDDPAHSADRHAALKFLQFIFEGVTGGYVEFRYFGPGRKPRVVDRPHYLALPLENESALDEVLRHDGERMITFGPAPRCRIPGS